MDRFRNILVGLDLDGNAESLSPGSRVAARQALWLARRTGARVQFIHSTYRHAEDSQPVPSRPGAGVEKDLELLRVEHGEGVDSSGLILCEERPWIALTRRVLSGDGDLVVVAKRNDNGGDSRRLGNVSMKLIRKCPGPVWVVKPDHALTHGYVVAATDLSAVGDTATDFGAFIAGAEECKLCIVHAWQVSMELQLSAARVGREEAARMKKEVVDAALRHIRGLPSVAGLGDQAEIFLACDVPSRAILGVVAEKKPDLVVMGTISRGGFAGMLVGNTAERLLTRLDCSLLTVKPADFVCPLTLDDD